MNEGLFAMALLLLVPAISLFLIIRMRLFPEKVPGRFAFVYGSLLIVLWLGWQVFKEDPGYTAWFLPSVYNWLDIAQAAVLVLGLLCVVISIALYADFWQTRRAEIRRREQNQSLLTNLQLDARQPYQLLEFLELALKEVVAPLPGSCGVLFLLNRGQRQFVMASSVGLNKAETARLEHYPLGVNAITQAVEIGESMVSASIEFPDSVSTAEPTRFRSSLVLPLISGSEKIGVLLLLSEERYFYGATEIEILSPVAEWLAEKIKTARLSRELSQVKGKLEALSAVHSDGSARIQSAMEALSARDVLESFCRAITGIAASQSVHLIGLSNQELRFYGGTEPLLGLSEGYCTALVNAIDGNKPLILNQEAVAEGGRSYVALSTLVYPLKGQRSQEALILRRSDGAFKPSQGDMGSLGLLAQLASLALTRDEIESQAITRRKGFRNVTQLLRTDLNTIEQEDPGTLVEHLSQMLPDSAIALAYQKQPNGSLRATHVHNSDESALADFDILPGEGIVGRALVEGEASFAHGRNSVSRELMSYESGNQDAFRNLFADRGMPGFRATCTLHQADDAVGVIEVFLYEDSDSQCQEWERLITLAVGLFSVRQTIGALYSQQLSSKAAQSGIGATASLVNRMNNHLSAVIGNAELAVNRPELTGETRTIFRNIISQAEQAAKHLEQFSGREVDGAAPESLTGVKISIDQVLPKLLGESLISENLYMIGGSPRELLTSFESGAEIAVGKSELETAFRAALELVTANVSEEDAVTVATYCQDEHVYLDLTKHRRDLPPMGQVAAFGTYRPLTADTVSVPPALPVSMVGLADALSESDCEFCVDGTAEAPAYLSLRFQTASETTSVDKPQAAHPRILAIDDQSVIRDLITAMGQSLGYDVSTVATGAEGIKQATGSEFDLILVDLAMSDISGLEVSRRIRRIRSDVPIVLVTGWHGRIEKEQLQESGITRVLYKPFRIEQLTEIIASAVPHRINS